MYATALLPAMGSPFGCGSPFRCCLLVTREHAPAFHRAGGALRGLRLGGGRRSFGLGDQVVGEPRSRSANKWADPVDPELVPRGSAAKDVCREVGPERARGIH